MPIYEYRCENGHSFELLQRMSDPAPEQCAEAECDAPVQKKLTAPAIHYKGSGFYATDYGKGKKAKAAAEAGKSDSSTSSGSSDSSTSSSAASSSSGSSSTSSTSSPAAKSSSD